MKQDKKKAAKPKAKVEKPVTPPAAPAAPEEKGPRQFTADEVAELQEVHRIANTYSFMAKQVKGNTALIPDGQKLGEQLEAMARLFQNIKNHWVSEKLRECGYDPAKKVSIDVHTGMIIPAEMTAQA